MDILLTEVVEKDGDTGLPTLLNVLAWYNKTDVALEDMSSPETRNRMAGKHVLLLSVAQEVQRVKGDAKFEAARLLAEAGWGAKDIEEAVGVAVPIEAASEPTKTRKREKIEEIPPDWEGENKLARLRKYANLAVGEDTSKWRRDACRMALYKYFKTNGTAAEPESNATDPGPLDTNGANTQVPEEAVKEYEDGVDRPESQVPGPLPPPPPLPSA